METEFECVKELIQVKGYKPKDIFNMDKTGLFYAYTPDQPILNPDSPYQQDASGLWTCRHSGVTGRKVQLTYVFTINTDGSENCSQ